MAHDEGFSELTELRHLIQRRGGYGSFHLEMQLPLPVTSVTTLQKCEGAYLMVGFASYNKTGGSSSRK